MPRLSTLLGSVALATAVPAQTFTSPNGFDTTEGDAAHFVLFSPSYERFMQIDNSQPGAATVRAMSFRRDGDLVSPDGGPRTLDLTVMMGHASYAGIGGNFANNYNAPATTVFTRRQVSTPDWSQLTGSTPQPFDLRIALDAPFAFNGNDAFVFELHMENVSQFGSPNVDREIGAPGQFTQAFGISSNDGCVVPGQGIEMTHALLMQNYGPNHPQYALRFGIRLARGPLNQQVVVNFDIVDQDLTIPGLCTKLHCMPGLSVGLGATNALGSLDMTFIDLPYLQRPVVGRRYWSQVIALDPSQSGIPASLSDARNAVFPPPPRPSPPVSYLYAPLVTDATAILWQDRGIVVQFEQ